WIKIKKSDTSGLFVVGNFGVTPGSVTVSIPRGVMYNYFNSEDSIVSGGDVTFTLQPSETDSVPKVYRYSGSNLTTPVSNVPWNGSELAVTVFPNPVQSAYNIKLQLPQSGNTI